jgi:hypothetical protein
MALSHLVHYLAPAAVSVAFGVAQTFNVMQVAPKGRQTPIHQGPRLEIALRILLLLLASSYVAQALVEVLDASRHNQGLYLPKDHYVYLLGSTVFWAIVGTTSMRPAYRTSSAVLVALVFEFALSWLAMSIPSVLALTVIRCALLLSVLAITLVDSRKNVASQPEETEALLPSNGTNGHVTRETVSLCRICLALSRLSLTSTAVVWCHE